MIISNQAPKKVMNEDDVLYFNGENFLKWNYMNVVNTLKGPFPYGQIVLLDGRMMECYPRAIKENEERNDNVPDEDREKEVNLFLKNAFYFLANKERILTDSRMFLCPVPINKDYASKYQLLMGKSPYPTLGVYLQWWEACAGTMRTDANGRKSLLCHVHSIDCLLFEGKEVYEDGSTKELSIINVEWPYDFHHCAKLFFYINSMYDTAKKHYQAYSLQQVLDILDHEEEDDLDYAQTINEQFHTHEIRMLNERVQYLETQLKTLYKRFLDAKLKLKEDTIIQFYEGYKALEQQVTTETEKLYQRKRDLKAALRRGEYTNKEYQPMLGELYRCMGEENRKLDDYKNMEMHRVFLDEEFTFEMIEDYYKRHIRPDVEKSNNDSHQ